MCLTKKVTIYKKPLNKTLEGWKVFRFYLDGLYGECYGSDSLRPEGQWIESTQGLVDEEHYPAGWHVFLRRKDAVKWRGHNDFTVIRKVRVRKIVARGLQTYYSMADVVVGRELFIPKERRRK